MLSPCLAVVLGMNEKAFLVDLQEIKVLSFNIGLRSILSTKDVDYI